MEQTVGDMNKFWSILMISLCLKQRSGSMKPGKVLDRLRDERLKLSLHKCQFYQPSVTYVGDPNLHCGHFLSQDVVSTDPKKTEAVTTWPRPSTVTLQSFLGNTGALLKIIPR